MTATNGLLAEPASNTATYMKKRGRGLARAERILSHVTTMVAGAALLASIGIVTYNVILRGTTGQSLISSTEWITVALSTIAFIGAAAATYNEGHIRMASLLRLWPQRSRPTIVAIGHLGTAVLLGLVLYYTYKLWPTLQSSMPASHLPEWSLYLPMVVGSALILLSSLIRFWMTDLWAKIAALVVMGVLTALGLGLRSELEHVAQNQPLLMIAVLVLVGLFLSIPIAFAFGIAASLLLVFQPGSVLTTIPLQIASGGTSFTLVTLPLFIFAGALLASAGISSRLIQVIDDLTCTWRGGTGAASVVAMYLFSGLSGSKLADIAAINPVSTPAMERKGHTREEVTGIYAASAVMGETVPPSVAMLVLASVANVSTGALFLAGLLPAAVVGIVLITAVLMHARSHGVTRSARPSAGAMWRHWRSALLPFGMPIIMVGGIVGGYATPEEASSVAVVYAILLSLLVYRVRLSELLRMIGAAARVAGMLLLLLAAANLLVWVMTVGGLTQQLERVTRPFQHSPIAFSLISVLVLIVAGMIFEGLPALVIFGPIFVPLAVQAGVDTLQYSVLLIMAMGVGAFLPPLGSGYFGTCSIVGVEPERAVKQTLYYKAYVILAIFLIALIPSITTIVPKWLG